MGFHLIVTTFWGGTNIARFTDDLNNLLKVIQVVNC